YARNTSLRLADSGELAVSIAEVRLSLRELCAHFFQLFVDFQNFNFVPQASPAAKKLGIFLSGAARLLGIPVTKQQIVRITTSIKKIAPISFVGNNHAQVAHRRERRYLHARQSFPDRDV